MRSVKTAIFFLLVLITVFISLGARCFYLQYSKNEHYNCISVKQQQKLVTQTPQRGEILDCRGRVLAASSQIQIIFADPREIDEPKDTSLALAPVVNMGAHNICRLICESRNPRFKKIKVGASETECRKAGRIHGVGVQSVWHRYYPAGELAAHVIGFTSGDNKGLGGIELQYEQELAGVPAKHVFFADARRRSIRLKDSLRTRVGVQSG
ncbi:MAG: hypothetical protein ACYSX1_13200 [Planctomycetota bacterium]